MIAVILFSLTAFAHDSGSTEARFENRADFAATCYGDDKDHPGKICRRRIHKGETCRGDAIGAGDGAPVFKVPNHTSFFVHGIDGLVVSTDYPLSRLMLDAARKLRPGDYGWMRWSYFVKTMGDGEVVDCEEVRK